MPKVRARFIAIQTTCRMSEAIEVKLRRGNDMFYLGVKPWGEGRSLDDVLSNRAIPLWGAGKSDVLITCYNWNAKYERTERK
jgi:hypothetical protein